MCGWTNDESQLLSFIVLTLALDTATAAASVALADGTRLLEVAAIDTSQPVATRLPADVMTLLERRRITLPEIDLLAVATGPGSFTGLRIGIATIQGLALAHGKPLLGVSTFDALASLVRASRVSVWIDAWRGEVYAATYTTGAPPGASTEPPALRMTGEPRVDTPRALLDRGATALGAEATAEAAALATSLFVGDGAVRYRCLIGPERVVEPTPLLAGAIATLAHERARAGELPPPHAIRPLYVRRPDAELARDRTR